MRRSKFNTLKEGRYLEDYVKGTVQEFGPVEVTEGEIEQFSQKFDPQIFHIDPEKAKETVCGGLIASGWHTCGIFIRLFVEHYLAGPASLGSPGVNELRWLKPVNANDQLILRVTVHKVKPSRSKPNRGKFYSYCEILNQDKTTVMTMIALNLIRYRASVLNT